MRVLHLFSNSKWTGPAEPALNLCVALRKLGVEADFACSPGKPKVPNKIVVTARERGVEPILSLWLGKHDNPFHNWRDARKLSWIVQGEGVAASTPQALRLKPYDLVHCHLDNDHRIAARALRGLPIPIVRSSYAGTGIEGKAGTLLHSAAMVLEPSEMARQHDTHAHRIPPERLRVIPNAVDTARFDPTRALPDGRARLNIPQDALLFGIVARMQTHRHYEDLFQAFHTLRQQVPSAHLVIIGRGTHQEEVGHRPVRELGLTGVVHFPGYTDGDDYVGLLRALDAAVFLVPGSDGTCRAVRELLAMAVPVIAADRGMLREIVTHEQNGLIFDGSVQGLEQALLRLAQDTATRKRMATAARARATADFALEVQARRVLAVYKEILPIPGGSAARVE